MSATVSSIPSPFFDPSSCFSLLSSYPWTTLARHFTALLLYGLAFAQWPTYGFGKANDLNRGYTLSTATFTLVFWCACFFHYTVSAGRVDVDWANGRFVARGWLVRSSRTTHRAILVMALAISSATVIQTSTVHSVFFMEQIIASNGTVEVVSDFTAVNLLKTDFVLCIVFSIYLGVRLCVEPTGILKRRRTTQRRTLTRVSPSEVGNDVNDIVVTTANSAETVDGSEANGRLVETTTKPFQCGVPELVEECQICLQRLANRQLNCGHLICCCCIIDLIKHASGPPSSLTCPFCRQVIYCARELRLMLTQNTVPLTECCSLDNEVVIV
ncbi:unnamed protein product [Toxocara canis]|uniref:RING-type domain-containing protein n=1 Tax=Toxocara canis TaxID=6265 RepID=A0A183UJE7_TOXCA|nr:unnamed protein product [Toxocara canis]